MTYRQKTVPVTCNKDCGGGCPLTAHVEDGVIRKITDSPLRGPYMKGCARGYTAHRMDRMPGRLMAPLIRKGFEKAARPESRPFTSAPEAAGQFRQASWDEALDLAAERLLQLKKNHGSTSLMDLSSGGACRGAVHNCSILTSRFLTLAGGATRLTGNYSSAAAAFSAPFVYGTIQTGMDAGNLEHSNLIVLWGYNALDTRFGSEFPLRILEARKKEVPVIVIDPRKTRTASVLGTRWIPIRPGTDTALIAAIVHRMIHTGSLDTRFIETCTHGFEPFREYILGSSDGIAKTPEWASNLCGIPEDTIVELADLYGSSRPAALLPGLSLQRALAGEEAARMTMVLQAVTGNVGVPGGSSGGAFWGKLARPGCASLPVPPNTDPGLPVYQWPDAILEGKQGGWPSDIRGVYATGSNLVTQGSDIRKNIRAFQRLDLAIGHDQFLTPTMALCDIIFPAASFLEREDIVFPAGNFLLYSAKAAEPPEGVKTDYEIFACLADRLGFQDRFTEGRAPGQWIDHLLASSSIPDPREFKETGIFTGEEHDRNAFSDFVRAPGKHPLATPSGKIEISSEEYGKLGYFPYPHYRGCQYPDPEFPLNLVTPHPMNATHSQYAQVPGTRKNEETRLWIHPDDAADRDIEPDDRVILKSPEGKIEIKVLVTGRVMKGTVSLTQGFWPHLVRDSSGSTLDRGGSANILTSTVPTLPSRSSRTHTVSVEVRKQDSIKPESN